MEKEITFQSFDGLNLEATVSIPSSGEKKTSVLLVHGIQTNRDEYGFYSNLSKYLFDFGIASFRFDHRANEKYLDQAVNLLTLSGVINDINQAFHVFKSITKSEKIVMVGASFGGGLSLYYANRLSLYITHCVLLAPVLEYRIDYLKDEDLLNELGTLNSKGVVQLEKENYLISSGRPFSRSIINELGHFDAPKNNVIPTTIIHGTKDSAVKIEYSRKFVNIAKNISLIEVDGVEHGFAFPGDEDLVHPKTLENHQNVYQQILNIIK